MQPFIKLSTMPDMSEESELIKGLEALSVAYNPEMITKLVAYLHLLQKWQKSYNLVADAEMGQLIHRHALDSLSIAPFIHNSRNLDIGTGAGFPGMVLAITYPQYHFSLLDSNGKKTRFLKQVCFELKIDNVDVIHDRIEKYQTTQCFNDIISRAVAPARELIALSKHCLCPGGRWLFMKGTNPTAEVEGIQYPTEIHTLALPDTSVTRHLIIVKG